MQSLLRDGSVFVELDFDHCGDERERGKDGASTGSDPR